MGTTRRDRMKGGEIPGTTPLVAIALIDIAVNIVCKEEETKAEFNTFQELPFFPPSSCLLARGPSNTHTAAAYKDDAEALQHPCSSHHPGQPQEEDYTKNVLQARQVNAHERAHLWQLADKRKQREGANISNSILIIRNKSQKDILLIILLFLPIHKPKLEYFFSNLHHECFSQLHQYCS